MAKFEKYKSFSVILATCTLESLKSCLHRPIPLCNLKYPQLNQSATVISAKVVFVTFYCSYSYSTSLGKNNPRSKMFKFLSDGDDGQDGNRSEIETALWRPSKEIIITDQSYHIAKEVPSSEYQIGSLEIKYILVNMLIKSDFIKEDENVKAILQSASDLNRAIYEGGFKIWECTFDLLQFINEHPDEIPIHSTTRILDLGCGSGLLGLYSLGKGADVHFQDYNYEVLNFLTIPNTLINYDDQLVSKCRYFCGDWKSMQTLMENSEDSVNSFTYDYILTSETIYNIENLSKLFNLVKSRLKPKGKLFLAAKTHYFGVGGGTKAFQHMVDEDLSMEWKVVKVFREGIQREIIEAKFKT